MTRRWRNIASVVFIGILLILLTPPPASAHGTSGVEPTNYKTVVTSVEPQKEGLTFRVVEAGNRVELTNTSNVEAVVGGYDNEPYFRVSKNGVFVNTRSPAYYLNRSQNADNPVSPDADSKALPEWKRIDSGSTATWHDHRAHWMGKQDPPVVRAAPDKRHRVIEEWTVPLTFGGEAVVVKGYLDWVPAPSATPWWILAAGAFAVGLFPALKRDRQSLLPLLLIVLIAVDMVHTAGLVLDASGSVSSRMSKGFQTALPSAIAWVVGIYGARRTRGGGDGGGADDGPWIMLFSAGLITFLGGFADLASLSNSQLPVALPPWIARACVALVVGLGSGLTVGLIAVIRRQRATLIDTEN